MNELELIKQEALDKINEYVEKARANVEAGSVNKSLIFEVIQEMRAEKAKWHTSSIVAARLGHYADMLQEVIR